MNDINVLVKLRISLLRSTNCALSDDCMDDYSESLAAFFAQHIPDQSMIGYVYCDGNIIKGYCLMYLYHIIPLINNLEGKIALLSDMYVEKDDRGLGIGTQLLAAIMSSAEKMGYPKVILNSTDNALELYKNMSLKNRKRDGV